MKTVLVLRHGEVDGSRRLTKEAKLLARKIGQGLPPFAEVISSDAARARETALLVAGVEPVVDARAGFYVPVEEHTRQIAQLAIGYNVDFVEAAYLYGAGKFADGMNQQAASLNDLVDEVWGNLLEVDGQALVVSHSTTIVPAIAERLQQPRLALSNLTGYQIFEDGGIVGFP